MLDARGGPSRSEFVRSGSICLRSETNLAPSAQMSQADIVEDSPGMRSSCETEQDKCHQMLMGHCTPGHLSQTQPEVAATFGKQEAVRVPRGLWESQKWNSKMQQKTNRKVYCPAHPPLSRQLRITQERQERRKRIEQRERELQEQELAHVAWCQASRKVITTKSLQP